MWTIFFSRKTSIEWIKFTRTVILILYLIIFYLILLHAQKVMKTVVLIGWILDVMEL
jgi:cell shape-determining protein MreC